METVENVCIRAKSQRLYVQKLSGDDKNKMLGIIAGALTENSDAILKSNAVDLSESKDKPKQFLDRLALSFDRIKSIAEGITELISLDDPVGNIMEKRVLKNGLKVYKVRVPLGVIGVIYEARPNVTADIIGLCLKSGNCCVLRGSRDAINTNVTIVKVIKDALKSNGFNSEFIQLVTDTSREGADALMRAHGLIDVLIPRGSAALIKSVVEKSTVPVIETGSGNCHAYVEKSADFSLARDIIINGKTSRPAVCNALESLVVDREIAKDFLPFIAKELSDCGVEIVGCDESVKLCNLIRPAGEDDFYTEYSALKLSVKLVGGVEEAIEHINRHSTSHSEVIITENVSAAERFLNDVDSAAVYVNASTRFTDGFEFGLGAEIGISTQKLHARGPMGLNELTSYKYQVRGSGQIRK